MPEKDRGTLEPALDELVERGFILIDYDTEELVVLTFPRDDGGYKHATRRKAVIANAVAIRSHLLRTGIAVELLKLGVEVPLSKPETSATQEPPDSHRDVVKEVSTIRNHTPEPEPETTSLEPQSTTHIPGRETRARGIRIPTGWAPSDELITAMRVQGIPDPLARRELLKFRDYWAAQPGAKGRKADWDATWRNWLRRAVEMQPNARPNGNTPLGSTEEHMARVAARLGIEQ